MKVNEYDECDVHIALSLKEKVESVICKTIAEKINALAGGFETQYTETGPHCPREEKHYEEVGNNVESLRDCVGFDELPMGEWYFTDCAGFDGIDIINELIWDHIEYDEEIQFKLTVNTDEQQIDITFKESKW